MMPREDKTFNFEMIAQVYREERNSATLTKLPPHFFKNIMDYIEKLRSNYIEERKNDPASPRTLMLEDEFHKSEKRILEIYELRERKIVLLALSAANGGNPKIDLMTIEEKNAFNNLVEVLIKNRSNIILNAKEDACEIKKTSSLGQKTMEKDLTKESIFEENNLTKEDMKMIDESNLQIDDSHKENPVILILEDIPSFETEERIFNLKKDDTITLPLEYARILCKHGKAKIIQS
ncbi:MAG: DNA replication complex GINS family protein [Thermoplasmata archaeon]|nr:MAG: DNA replication complex GINS family protein [Thermoplasmata archaeon]